MALNWSTTRREGTLHGCKVLCYGDAGMGKTTLCATMPDPLILSEDSGLLSLRKFDLPVLVIRSLADIDDAYRFLTESADAKRFQSVGLDSISGFAEKILAEELEKNKDPRQAYGAMANKMELIIKYYRDLPGMNVCMTAKMEPMKDEMSGAIKWSPSFPGRVLPVAAPYMFDEVFVIRKAEPVNAPAYRYLQTQPDLQHVAKDRSGALGPIEKPDLDYVFRKMVG